MDAIALTACILKRRAQPRRALHAVHLPRRHQPAVRAGAVERHALRGRLPLAGRLLSASKRTLQRGLYSTHDYGMVGFVKELVDELGAADITHPQFGAGEPRVSRFREMRLSPSHLFVVKA